MEMTITDAGATRLRERVTQARMELATLVQRATLDMSEVMVDLLSEAAPKGSGGGIPPEGDASGPLSDSFYPEFYPEFEGKNMVRISTLQPTKLKYVVEGTGIYGPKGQRITPVNKKALSWEGADHPVRSVAGQKPNDFVTPALAKLPGAEESLQPIIDGVANVLQGK